MPEIILFRRADGVHHTRFKVGCKCREIFEYALHVLTLCLACDGAVWFHNGQLKTLCNAKGVLLGEENKRAYERHVFAPQIRYRAESIEAAFVYQAQEKRFENVLTVMAERNLLAAALDSGIIQRAAP